MEIQRDRDKRHEGEGRRRENKRLLKQGDILEFIRTTDFDDEFKILLIHKREYKCTARCIDKRKGICNGDVWVGMIIESNKPNRIFAKSTYCAASKATFKLVNPNLIKKGEE